MIAAIKRLISDAIIIVIIIFLQSQVDLLQTPPESSAALKSTALPSTWKSHGLGGLNNQKVCQSAKKVCRRLFFRLWQTILVNNSPIFCSRLASDLWSAQKIHWKNSSNLNSLKRSNALFNV